VSKKGGGENSDGNGEKGCLQGRDRQHEKSTQRGKTRGKREGWRGEMLPHSTMWGTEPKRNGRGGLLFWEWRGYMSKRERGVCWERS